MATWTVQSVLDWTTDYFKDNHIESARLEAELLLANVLNCKRLELNLQKDLVIPEKKLGIYKNHIVTRKSRKPLSYILGNHEFMGLKFTVNENTLIPRPETEILVEETLKIIKHLNTRVVVDMCTGSGCIGISIAKNCDLERVYVADISTEALSVCWQNVTDHGLAAKVMVKQGDLFDALKDEGLEGKVGLIVSNPPYIAKDEFKSLMPELNYEPKLALDGGKDGLDFYRRLAGDAKVYLMDEGRMALELNSNKLAEIIKIFEAEKYYIEKVIKDYAGLDRVLVVKNIKGLIG